MFDKNWKILTGKKIPSLKKELDSIIKKEIEDDIFNLEILVGCDNQTHRYKTVYDNAKVFGDAKVYDIPVSCTICDYYIKKTI